MARVSRHSTAATAVTVAAVLAGCGAQPRVRSPSAAPAREPALFRYECGGCHTIGTSNSPHQGPGGDVLTYRLPRRDMLTFTREMPRAHGTRTEAQVADIVDYLQRLQRAGVR